MEGQNKMLCFYISCKRGDIFWIKGASAHLCRPTESVALWCKQFCAPKNHFPISAPLRYTKSLSLKDRYPQRSTIES